MGVVLTNQADVTSENLTADDLVGSFLTAVATGDLNGLMDTMADNAEMVTPLSSRAVIRGRDDLRLVFAAFLPVLSQDLHWRIRVGDGRTTVAVANARIGGVSVEDAMLIEQDADGRILRVTPHVRPWLGLTVSALVMGPKLAAHPQVMLRAMRRK